MEGMGMDEENKRFHEDRQNAFKQEILDVVKESITSGLQKQKPEPGTGTGNVDVNLGIVKWSMEPTPSNVKCFKWTGWILIGLAVLGTLVKLAIEMKKGFWPDKNAGK